MKNQKTLGMVMTGLFMAIIIIMTFVPNVGYINLVVIKATLLHVPVIVGSIVLGPKKGAILGAVFGITSIINNTFNPSLLSFAFSPFYSLGDVGGNGFSLVISLVPRILVGIVPYYVYQGVLKLFSILTKKKSTGSNSGIAKTFALPLACVMGSFTNTILVMNFIYIFFKEDFATARELALDAVYGAILAIIAANGIPEAIVAALIGSAISAVLLKLMPRRQVISNK
jgi:uncharacterized membrane protein